MITTDMMCTNRIVAVAAGGGGGPRTIEKRVKMCTFSRSVTENANNPLLGAVVHTPNRGLAHSYLHIRDAHDVSYAILRGRRLIVSGGRELAS